MTFIVDIVHALSFSNQIRVRLHRHPAQLLSRHGTSLDSRSLVLSILHPCRLGGEVDRPRIGKWDADAEILSEFWGEVAQPGRHFVIETV